MATHDYVIANNTGANVRSDINGALAAIVSNNSSSTEPSTTYAYQWWADTNANVLKIRNSANNAWITLRELDGTMLIEDGSASTPGLAFADDVNTGIFSGAADQIGFATGGAERLEIGSSEVVVNDPSNDVDFRVESDGNTHMFFVDGGNNRVGIGEDQTLDALLVIKGDSNAATNPSIRLKDGTDTREAWISNAAGDLVLVNGGNDNTPHCKITLFDGNILSFETANTERMRIHSTGNVSFVNGIVLGAGSNDTADNTLDDYEEGTFTPGYAGATTAGTYTFATRTGHYTKVGDMVNATIKLTNITDTTEGSGEINITGLPFTSENDGSFVCGSVVLDNFNAASGTVSLAVRLEANSTAMDIRETRDSDTDAIMTVGDRTSDAADIFCTITYRTA